MSNICRYFLRGTCRFGNQCRFSHSEYDPDDGYEYDQYESYDSSQQYYGRQLESNAYNKERYSRYDQYSSGGRYNENQRSTDKIHSRSNDRYDSYNERYDSPAKSYQTSDSKYGQNRFRWLSPDYNKQSNDQETYNNYQKQRNPKPSLLSTPKEKVSFSFNSAISEIKSDHSKESNFRTSNEIRKLSELVAEEARVWEKGKQWPFTCFCPFLEKSNLPSFVDLSPEELRFQAYKAKENNTYGAYVSSVDSALIEVIKNRTQYKMQEPEKLAIIERIHNGEHFKHGDSISSIFGNLMGCKYSYNTEPMHHEIMPSSIKSSASTFRFVLPDDETVKTSSTSEDNSTYTPIDKLSLNEKEQYESSTFTLGKVPTKPPPRVLCF